MDLQCLIVVSTGMSYPPLTLTYLTTIKVTADNVYDYDIPPGLVTLRVAKTIINLYRLGMCDVCINITRLIDK